MGVAKKPGSLAPWLLNLERAVVEANSSPGVVPLASSLQGPDLHLCRVNAAVYRFAAPWATDIACARNTGKDRLPRTGRHSCLIEALVTGRS